MRPTFSGRQPEIDYPCRWSFTVIGEEEDRLRNGVQTLLDDEDYELAFGHASRKGNYVSLHLTVQVQDESHRLRLFDRLGQLDAVRYVL